jgi:hypothetical protein
MDESLKLSHGFLENMLGNLGEQLVTTKFECDGWICVPGVHVAKWSIWNSFGILDDNTRKLFAEVQQYGVYNEQDKESMLLNKSIDVSSKKRVPLSVLRESLEEMKITLKHAKEPDPINRVYTQKHGEVLMKLTKEQHASVLEAIRQGGIYHIDRGKWFFFGYGFPDYFVANKDGCFFAEIKTLSSNNAIRYQDSQKLVFPILRKEFKIFTYNVNLILDAKLNRVPWDFEGGYRQV